MSSMRGTDNTGYNVRQRAATSYNDVLKGQAQNVNEWCKLVI